MSELALLIGAIATLITAIGGATTAVITALRAGDRERRKAATAAVLEADPDARKDIEIAALRAELRKLQDGDGP